MPVASGHAASALMLILLLGSVGYAAYRLSPSQTSESARRAQLIARMAYAREALIAYAVVDAKRPGRLLCPDLTGSGISPLLNGNDCPGYNGWLPWKTLDLSGEGDDRGQALRYVVSPQFGGDRATSPLNSDTPASLHLDAQPGVAGGDIAALLIAPRGPLDPANADGDDRFFNGRTTAPGDNDVVLAVSREQLMAATEQRIANQIRACLNEHARSSGNPEQAYPWPAPLGKSFFQGTGGSLFGRLPDTQPGNPEVQLQSGIARLSARKSQLEADSSSAERLQGLKDLQQQAGLLRALFDRLYEIALRVDTQAKLTNSALSQLDAKLAKTPTAPDIPVAAAAARTPLAALIAAIEDGGLDSFEQELATLNSKLHTDIGKAAVTADSVTLGNLATSIDRLKSPLLGSVRTPSVSVQQQVDANRQLAIEASLAANDAKTRPGTAAIALVQAQALFDANARLGEDIRASRVNLDPAELRHAAVRIGALANTASTSGTTAPDNDLTRTLNASLLRLRQASSPSTPVQDAITTLVAALSATQANDPATASACSSASDRLTRLAAWLETAGNHLTLETLKTVDASLLAASRGTALQASEASALRATLAMAIYWGQVASTQAGELARSARKSIAAKNDSDTSAYTAARRFIDSLDGATGSIALLEKSIASPTTLSRDSAETALASSLARLSELIDASNRLDATLSGTHAQAAVPTAWLADACDFLQAANASTSWWFTQQWKSLFFYQISERIRPERGALTVNGKGKHPLVVIAAGRPLPGRQDRSEPSVTQFLEGRNTHASRDGLAQEPSRDFSQSPRSPDFNDQIAY